MQRHRNAVTRRGYLLTALAASLLVSACASYPDVAELEQLKRRDAAKPFYGELLALQYEQLAITEADYRGDTAAARFYATKGNLAAQGQAVAPESPTTAAGQEEAHARLLGYFDNQMDLIAPAMLARAQASFDCWVEESRQGDSQNSVAECRDNFSQAVAALDTQLPPVPLSDLTADYTLFFATGSMRLPDNAPAVVEQIVAAVEAGDVKAVRLAGYSDRAGSAETNLRLSDERARSVQRALTDAGLPGQIIDTEAFGETELLVDTPDGVSEGRNRRVEIFLVR